MPTSNFSDGWTAEDVQSVEDILAQTTAQKDTAVNAATQASQSESEASIANQQAQTYATASQSSSVTAGSNADRAETAQAAVALTETSINATAVTVEANRAEVAINTAQVALDSAQVAADTVTTQANKDAAQILHDTVVLKEALVSPHYTAIDNLSANITAIDTVNTNLPEILQADDNAAIATAKAAEAAASALSVDPNLTVHTPGSGLANEAGTAYAADILGTVSQTGGIPTGAILESGSNLNGEYIKYADGTLVCVNWIDNVNSGDFITPPSAIISTVYKVSVSARNTSGITTITHGNKNLTGFNVYLSGATNIDYILIGRWF